MMATTSDGVGLNTMIGFRHQCRSLCSSKSSNLIFHNIKDEPLMMTAHQLPQTLCIFTCTHVILTYTCAVIKAEGF